MIQENFLYFLWKYQYFNAQSLSTVEGELIAVESVGFRNDFAGPDFKEARIRIAGMKWVGSVEMHVKASDWFRHGHQSDENYHNVILHVVWEADRAVLQADGKPIPTLALQPLVKAEVLNRYLRMVDTRERIPCHNSLKKVKAITRLSMVERVLVSRIQGKAETFNHLLNANGQDWEETAYQWLASGFGFKTNADNMLSLAQSLPLKILQKHRNNPEQIEALFFGQAGFLDVEIKDDYPGRLQREYRFLKNKYGLKNRVHYNDWHFARVRPSNYPTLRLSQMVSFVLTFPHIFRFFAEVTDFKSVMDDLEVHQSEYWQSHYAIDKPSNRKLGALAKGARQNLIINTTVPFLAALAKAHDRHEHLETALNLLAGIPAERNHITELWTGYGWNVSSAFDSQGLIQLYNHHCAEKRCVDCAIGAELIRGISGQ